MLGAPVAATNEMATCFRIARPSIACVRQSHGPAATKSSALDFSRPDRINDAVFNQLLWEMLKGSAPMPPTPHTPLR